jgi:hypothetical protein
MILKLLKLKIKELRGCPRVLNLIDEYVGNKLNDRMDEFHKVIHFFEKCVQFLIRKGHTHRISDFDVNIKNKTFQQHKESYMKLISYSLSMIYFMNSIDSIDNIHLLNVYLFDKNDTILSETYLYYTVMFKKNTFGKKTNNEPYCRIPKLDIYYDKYKVKCKICNSFECNIKKFM